MYFDSATIEEEADKIIPKHLQEDNVAVIAI